MDLRERIEIFSPANETWTCVKVEVSPIVAIAANHWSLYLASETEIYSWLPDTEPNVLTDEIVQSNLWVFDEAIYVEAARESTKLIQRIDNQL
jgi:hypothetical protein